MNPELSQDEIAKRIQLLKENCIFCKIINKEIPSRIVYEDDLFLAFLDINPISKGHIILIPKEHYMMITLVPDDILAQCQIVAKQLSILLQESLDCKDVIQFIPNGQAAGQQIQHFAIHLVPQYGDDNLLDSLHKIEEISKDELENIHSKVISNIS